MVDYQLFKRKETKEYMEDLLNGQAVTVNFDEQMVFEQLDYNENAIWSLLLASGYLKAEEVEYRGITLVWLKEMQKHHIRNRSEQDGDQCLVFPFVGDEDDCCGE